MELPRSGWYPDPYGVHGLLRWWDGSTWTRHTHASSAAGAADGTEPGAGGAGVPATAIQPAIQPAAARPPSLQPTTVQPAVLPATTVQPAVPATAAQAAVAPTAVQPAVQAGGTTGAPGATGATGGWPVGAAPLGSDGGGTQVLFLGGDAWTKPGGPGQQGDRYGYQRAQRRRRMWMTGGLVGGTAVALGLIALVVSSLANSGTTRAAATNPPVRTPTTTAPAPSPTPSPTPTVTQPAAPLTDGTSGLSYSILPAWQPNCPGSLAQGFSWSAGESAIAQQVNGGQTTWYGEACSAPLPQQYGYNGVADLQNVTTNLANQFVNSYYNGLTHGYLHGLSQPLEVSGHAGWEITYTITYQNTQGLQFSTEEAAVAVIDLGSGVAPAVFFTSIPSNLGESNVDSLVSSLQAAAPTSPGGGGSPADGSPGDGGN